MKTTILFTYDPKMPIKGTLQKYGEYEDVLIFYEKYLKTGLCRILSEDLILIENVSEEDVQKMVDITGYVGVWYEKNFLSKSSQQNGTMKGYNL